MSTASKVIMTTAVLSLASLPALGATTVFEFGSADYISGAAAPVNRLEQGNHPYRNATDGNIQKAGNRPYSETYSLTGPAAGLNVGVTPLLTNGNQTYSGYTGPELFGGIALRTINNTAVWTTNSLVPGLNYGATNGTSSSGEAYFQVGLRNDQSGRFNTIAYDALAAKYNWYGTVVAGDVITTGVRNTELAMLALGKMASPVEFDADSKIDFVVGAPGAFGFSGITARANIVRAVVKAGEQYYISDFSETISNNSNTIPLTGVFDYTELSTGTWSAYDPTTSIYVPTTTSTTISLTDITYAGVLITHVASQNVTATGAAGMNGEVYLGSLKVTASAAIPEPASLALLVLGSALIGFRRQR